ncbi:hypothetical protein OHAE_5375 [Ochrobactrum soli]|uniref:Uncharacterized protein n=1 Tax=Ochrobactrum soli TaxID=2448455 RepID=A0A2P9HDX6_9HYPH|nr:hypothetical protein OHAE_5375 [[Ochrobactrum] soli]
MEELVEKASAGMLTPATAMLPMSRLRLETKNRSVSDAIAFLLSRCVCEFRI